MFDQNATSPFTTIVTTPAQTTAQKPLRESVKQAVNKYLKQLENIPRVNWDQLIADDLIFIS